MSRKIKLIVVLLAIIIIIAAVGVYAFNQKKDSGRYKIISFDYERAYEDEEELTSYGPRLAGTDEAYQGAVYIKNQFEEAGLDNVQLKEYETLLYEVNSASVSLIQYLPLGNLPDPRYDPIVYSHTMDFVVQGYSGSYQWSSSSDDLEIVDIGDGADDGMWQEAEGKAAIVAPYNGGFSNTNLFFKASYYGASALILHNTVYGEEIGYVPISKSTGLPSDESSYPDIPFFMVSKAMGEEIKAGIDTDMKLRLDFDVTVEVRTFWVVIGDVKGSENPNKFVMLGAHHDTVYNGPGAVDNTVGTVTVIELARQLARHDPKKTIRLATWGAEEEGLLGSKAYMNEYEEYILKNCMMYLNFDMNNVDLKRGNKLPLLVADNSSVKHMKNIAKQILKDHSELEKYDIDIYYEDVGKYGSDQLIFTKRGVKSAVSFGDGSLEYHTYLDTIEHVNAESLSLSGRIFGSYALYLANK